MLIASGCFSLKYGNFNLRGLPHFKYFKRLLQLRHISCPNYSVQEDDVVFSGIQPSGVPHLGNYFGALRQWIELQSSPIPKSQLYFSIVDLHAITLRQNPQQLRRWKNEALATLLAVGLDPKRCTIFFQSDVSIQSCES